jgi:hypothetical protein
MSNKDIFLKELSKIKQIPIKKEGVNSVSGILLFKDYLSKMHQWYNELQLDWDYKITKEKEGHNLIMIIAPELMNDCVDLNEFRLTMLNDTSFNTDQVRSFDYLFIYLSIYWGIFKNTPKIKQYEYLPEPYEPVMKILLRGGHISFKETFYNVSGIDISKKSKTLSYRLPSLDEDFLDFIDVKCKLSGSDGIPSQESTNALWNEFENR